MAASAMSARRFVPRAGCRPRHGRTRCWPAPRWWRCRCTSERRRGRRRRSKPGWIKCSGSGRWRRCARGASERASGHRNWRILPLAICFGRCAPQRYAPPPYPPSSTRRRCRTHWTGRCAAVSGVSDAAKIRWLLRIVDPASGPHALPFAASRHVSRILARGGRVHRVRGGV